jgi:hypothetical protein
LTTFAAGFALLLAEFTAQAQALKLFSPSLAYGSIGEAEPRTRALEWSGAKSAGFAQEAFARSGDVDR